jgi:hypothetical protein
MTELNTISKYVLFQIVFIFFMICCHDLTLFLVTVVQLRCQKINFSNRIYNTILPLCYFVVMILDQLII